VRGGKDRWLKRSEGQGYMGLPRGGGWGGSCQKRGNQSWKKFVLKEKNNQKAFLRGGRFKWTRRKCPKSCWLGRKPSSKGAGGPIKIPRRTTIFSRDKTSHTEGGLGTRGVKKAKGCVWEARTGEYILVARIIRERVSFLVRRGDS